MKHEFTSEITPKGNGRMRGNKKESTSVFLSYISFAVSLFNAALFFSMRSAWGGVYAVTGIKWLPMTVFLCLDFLAVLSFVFACRKKFLAAAAVVNGIFFAVLGYILYAAFEMLPFFIYEFSRLAAVLALVGLAAALILKFPVKNKVVRVFKIPAVVLLTVITLCAYYDLQVFNKIKDGPAVFAVGDNYQIVFTTRKNSIAWVDIGTERYADTYAGSSVSETTTHKIEVPMPVLDAAGFYSINAQTIIYRGPYDGIKGRLFTQSYTFTPVREQGNLRFYAISDTHEYTKEAIAAASYWGDDIDFLVLLGDHASFIVSEADLTRALTIAAAVTKGQAPVIYARGNHEVKGRQANTLHRYIGADGENFFYTFRIGSVWGVVLDSGEDHGDDWWEFYGTAYFDNYRYMQTEFLKRTNEDAASEYNAPGISTRIAVCHIPFAYYTENDYWLETKNDWINELNKMNLNLVLSGHTHRLFWITQDTLPGSELVLKTGRRLGFAGNLNVPSVIVSTQTGSQETGGRHTGKAHTGLAVEIKGAQMNLIYTNNRGEIILLNNPFTGLVQEQPLIFHH